MFVPIEQNLHGTVTDIDQVDQHLNTFAASRHIVAERPESFLLIVAYFNIPPKWVQKQRNVFHTVTSGLVQWRFFLPHTITKGTGKIRYLIPIPDGYAEHDTYKAVSIQVIGTVVCGMVKQFWNIFKFCAKWDTIVSSTHRNTGYVCKESGISFKAILTVVFINLE